RARRWPCCPSPSAPARPPSSRRCTTSSSRTAATSTTSSSTSSPSRPDALAVVACGALAAHVADVATRRGWAVDVQPLPPLLHNRPERIAGEVEQLVTSLRPTYGERVAVAYADCGTYG